MKMTRLKAAVLAFAGIAIVLTAQNRARAGALMTVHDTTTVVVKLTIGNPPTTTVSGAVQGHVSSSLSIVPATTYRHITASTRFINVSGSAGNTVTLTCPFTLSTTFSNPKVRYVFDLGASNDLFTSHGEPTRYIEYRSYVAGTTPSGRFGPLANFAHHANAFPIAGGSTPMSVCVDLKISIPAYATPGSYYTTVAGLFYDGAGGIGKPTPTPAPTSTPTPTESPTPTPATYPAVVLADRPAVYYHMDENPATAGSAGTTLTDASGNGYNGQIPAGSATYFASVAGAIPTYADPALRLSTANAFVQVPYGVSTTGYTVEAWVNTTSFGYLEIHDGPYHCQQSFYVDIDPSDMSNLGVTANGTIVASFGKYEPTFQDPTVGVVSKAAVVDGKWHHVVVTWAAPSGSAISASQFHIYVDGVDSTGPSFVHGTLALTSPVAIDQFNAPCQDNTGYGVGQYFNISGYTGGPVYSVDEFAVYSYALTQAQILNHYHTAGY